ncbi:MAG: helix-turn-helix transcriptional regulator [Bacteriovoracales bacterium]|nr:helix-turn-helix transcriptional regulator [Bacteriovoracales bacterium]
MRCFNHMANLIRTKRAGHPKEYSQVELSNLLGYKSGQFISNVERALCGIPFKMLGRVSEILDIPPGELKEAILKDIEVTIDDHLQRSRAASQNTTSSVDLSENPKTAAPAEW